MRALRILAVVTALVAPVSSALAYDWSVAEKLATPATCYEHNDGWCYTILKMPDKTKVLILTRLYNGQVWGRWKLGDPQSFDPKLVPNFDCYMHTDGICYAIVEFRGIRVARAVNFAGEESQTGSYLVSALR